MSHLNRRNRLIGCAIIVDVPIGIQAVSLGDNLTQLMVSSAHSMRRHRRHR